MNYIVIVEIKIIVPLEECVILKNWFIKQIFSPWKIVRKKRFILESQLESGNIGSTMIDTLFPTFSFETKETNPEGFGVWDIVA